ncbi:hypothetical protein FQA47_020276 [Oryzias melastigma]|uniref:Uncharacterized protein n=1 Tax=Oryzias melastigma TaxID=30732 RepID=A0A834KZ36_ORYME|nr:hypothetical protein FQA47_020276 [Oryzias melastigma]
MIQAVRQADGVWRAEKIGGDRPNSRERKEPVVCSKEEAIVPTPMELLMEKRLGMQKEKGKLDFPTNNHVQTLVDDGRGSRKPIVNPEFLGEVETQNRVVQKNPAVFTGPLSVAAPPGSASKQGKLSLRKTFHQDQSTLQQQQQRPTPSFPTKQPAQKPPQPNPQPQPLTSASQTTLQPVNERPAGGNQGPTSGVQADESRSEGPTDPEKHADSELQDRVPTTEAAPEKRKRETVDNDVGGVPEDPASDVPARQRFYWPSITARTLMMLVDLAQKI